MVLIFPGPGTRGLSYPHQPQEEPCCDALSQAICMITDPLVGLYVPVLYTELEDSNRRLSVFAYHSARFVVCTTARKKG